MGVKGEALERVSKGRWWERVRKDGRVGKRATNEWELIPVPLCRCCFISCAAQAGEDIDITAQPR
jgi:hypothetical protein